MEDTVVTTETTQEPLAPAVTPSAPHQDNTSATDVEALKSQLKKLEMERNLLRNRVDSTSKELEDKTKKELEEKEDYRALAQRLQDQLETINKEKQEADYVTSRSKATDEVLKDYDPRVIDIAKTAGLQASDDSEQAKEELKAKVDAIASKLGSATPKVQGSNIAPITPNEETAQPRVGGYAATQGSDWVTRARTVTENGKLASDKVSKLQILDSMRQIAGVERQNL